MEPTTGDVFKARFLDCHFDEHIYPSLITPEHPLPPLEWERHSPFWQDLRTNQGEKEVQRILQLHKIVEELPDAFVDTSQVTRSHIPAARASACIELSSEPASTSQPRSKRGRPLGSKDKQPRRRGSSIPPSPDVDHTDSTTHEEISIHHAHTGVM